MKFRIQDSRFTVFVIALAGMVLHLGFANTMEYHRDELLYFSQSLHLSFGYFSVPPLSAWLAFVSARFLGYNLFAAKFLPALAGGFTVFLCGSMARELGGGSRAQVMAAISMSCSLLFLRAFYLFEPVPFDIFFWTLMFYFLLKFLNTHQNKFLIYLGITLGFSLLNKYNPLFLLIAFLIVIPFTPERLIFRNRKFYTAALVAFLIFLPNLIWQLNHGLPVIHHMKELSQTQLVHMSLGIFLKEQLLIIMSATLIGIPGILMLLLKKDLRRYWLIGMMCIVVLLIFILLKGKSYYTAGIYPVMLAAGAVGITSLTRRNFMDYLIILFLIASTMVILPLGIPVFKPEKMVSYFDGFAKITGSNDVRRFEDNQYHPLPQDYADMLGWNELTLITATAWQQVADKDATIIYAENYGEAGAIRVIGRKYGLPEPVSFNESFIYWRPLSFKKEIKTVIYINDEPGDDVQDLFGDIRLAGRI
ncbi:MAG: glycosyltransferase family 39 protein, partial [Syntrophothermus sp.]